MRKEQRHIQPRDEIEEKDARNEGVLRRDQVKHERAGAGNGLAQAEAMLPEQFVLQKIMLRSVAAERLQQHAENEHSAVRAVTLPGQAGGGGVKGCHHPDAKPEEQGDNNDLAEQEKAIKTFRPLRDHMAIGSGAEGAYAMAAGLQLKVKRA